MSGDGDVDGWKMTGGDQCGSRQVRYPGVVAVARALERWCGLGAGERPCPGVVGVTSVIRYVPSGWNAACLSQRKRPGTALDYRPQSQG